MTQEVSHHGRLVREYEETRVGITQVELAHRIGKSRRTVVTLEQMARIDDLKLRHSTRFSEQAINDGRSQSHTLLGRPGIAIESYDKLEKSLDLSMTRMRGRLYR